MKRVFKLINDNFEESIMAVLLITITVIMTIQIVSRYVFNDSISWGEEYCRYGLVYSTFLAFPVCIKRRITLKIDILMDLFPKKARWVLELIGNLASIFFYGYFAYSSIAVIKAQYLSGVVSAIVKMPLWVVYVIVPIGFFLAFLRQIWDTYLYVTGKKSDLEYKREVIE